MKKLSEIERMVGARPGYFCSKVKKGYIAPDEGRRFSEENAVQIAEKYQKMETLVSEARAVEMLQVNYKSARKLLEEIRPPEFVFGKRYYHPESVQLAAEVSERRRNAVTISEASAKIGVSRQTLQIWELQGKFNVLRIKGMSPKVEKEEIKRMIKEVQK